MKKAMLTAIILFFTSLSACDLNPHSPNGSSSNTAYAQSQTANQPTAVSSSAYSSSSFVAPVSSITSQSSSTGKPVAPWSVRGTVTPDHQSSGNDLLGFEITFRLNENQNYEVNGQLGQTDKIESFEIRQNSVTITVSKKYTLHKFYEPIGGFVNLNNTGYGSEDFTVSEDASHYYLTVKLKQDYNKSDLKSILFSYGKVD